MRSRIFISSVQKEFAEERKLLVADVLAAKHSVPKGPSWGLSRGPSRGAVRAQSPREKCLILLAGSELKRKEIAVGVRMPSRSGYLSRMLAELVEDGLIERTIPDKPNSSQQRYRLTEKGQQVVRGNNDK